MYTVALVPRVIEAMFANLAQRDQFVIIGAEEAKP